MIRIDRILSLVVFKNISNYLLNEKEECIPILMYHSISDDKEDGIHPYYRINTSRNIFAEQMNYIRENGYTVIHANDVMDSFRNNIERNQIGKSKKYLAITFDDGYGDFYDAAYPILKRHDYSATVYLPAGYIDNCRNAVCSRRRHLTWREICELAKEGVSFGSHSISHKLLHRMKRDDLENEIRRSKEMIEDKTGVGIRSFSYPYAFPENDTKFIAVLSNMLAKHGYTSGVSTIIGRVKRRDHKFTLKRIPINTSDDKELFEGKLKGYYDWLHTVQYLSKRIHLNTLLKRAGLR